MHRPALCRSIHRFHKAILTVATGCTLVGGALAGRLTVDADLAALLPGSFASAKALSEMGESVVWTSHLRVALKTENFQAALALADSLAPRLQAEPLVASVTYRNDVAFYERHALLFLEEARLDSLYDAVCAAMESTRQAYNPLMVDDLFGDGPGPAYTGEGYRDHLRAWEDEYRAALPKPYLANPARTVLVLDVTPAGSGSDLAMDQALLDHVRQAVDALRPTSYAADMEVHYGGNVRNRITEVETLKSDILGTAALGVAGVLLLLSLAFRSVVVAALISVSLAASLAWTFGFTFLVLGKLNSITGFLFLVLFGLGVDHGIHAMARYREARRDGLSTHDALHQMVCRGGRALLTSAGTSAAAFFSLTLFEFRGFSELGLITGVGMLFAVAAMLLVLPSLVILAEGRGLLPVTPAPAPRPTRSGAFPWARTILAGSALLTLASAVVFSRVTFQYDLSDLRIITPERAAYARVTAGVFPPVESPAVVMAATPEAVNEVIHAVEAIRLADTETPTVDRVGWVGSLVPPDQAARLDRIRALRDLVDGASDTPLEGRDARRLERLRRSLVVEEPFTWTDFPAQDRARFSGPDGGPGDFVLIYPAVSLRDGRNAMAFRDDIGTFRGASGAEYHAASPNIIVADLLTMVTREGPLAALLALAVVFLIVLVSTGTLRGALLVMTPLVVGLTWTGALMVAAGMQLNFFNLVVFPSLVGIGVDDGVHLVHRFREEGPGSVPLVLRRTGMAVVLTTLTTMVGYGGLALAHHPGLRAIGVLAVMGLAATLVSATVVLPALLERFGAPLARAPRE